MTNEFDRMMKKLMEPHQRAIEAATKAMTEPMNQMLAQMQEAQAARTQQMINAMIPRFEMPRFDTFKLTDFTLEPIKQSIARPVKREKPRDDAYTFARKKRQLKEAIEASGKVAKMYLIMPGGEEVEVRGFTVDSPDRIHFYVFLDEAIQLAIPYREIESPYQFFIRGEEKPAEDSEENTFIN